jgi:general secretion pathway protein J
MRDNRGSDGFTILELIVCLGVLALIAVFMAEGVALIGRGRVVMAGVEGEEALRAVQVHVRRTLGRAVPLFAAREGEAAILFAGSPDRLTFVTRSDRRLEGGGDILVELRAEADEGAMWLVTDRRPLAAPPNVPPQTRVLLDGIAALRLRYYGRADPLSPPAWTKEWVNPNALAELVEVAVDFDAESGQEWPTLTIALPAAH